MRADTCSQHGEGRRGNGGMRCVGGKLFLLILFFIIIIFFSYCKPQGRIFQVDKDQHSINLRLPAEDVLPGYNLDWEEI